MAAPYPLADAHESLASRPQVLEKCPVLGSRTALFKLLKFCRSPEKVLEDVFFCRMAKNFFEDFFWGGEIA